MSRSVRLRAALLSVIAVSWVALLGLMWRAFNTLPTPEQMADGRHVRPPLPIDLMLNSITSGGELIFASVMLWPWWRRRYALRALIAFMVLAVWFIASAPMSINRMEQHHRRWLALLAVTCLVVALASSAAHVIRRRSERQ